jgi:hypothetical protein
VTDVVIPLTIRDLTPEDLPPCAWWVSAQDIAQLGETLQRVRRGEAPASAKTGVLEKLAASLQQTTPSVTTTAPVLLANAADLHSWVPVSAFNATMPVAVVA